MKQRRISQTPENLTQIDGRTIKQMKLISRLGVMGSVAALVNDT